MVFETSYSSEGIGFPIDIFSLLSFFPPAPKTFVRHCPASFWGLVCLAVEGQGGSGGLYSRGRLSHCV